MNLPAMQTAHEVSVPHNDRTLSFLDSAVQTFDGIDKVAKLMAQMGTMPKHLVGKPADCFRIVIQAAKWRMDPFAVAECTSLVHGRMCYEGKLVAAVLRSTGAIEGRLEYKIEGTGKNATITITGTPRGGKPEVLKGSVKEWETTHEGSPWAKQPETMLVYRGTRQWARLYAPEAILGVVTPDEAEDIREVVGTVVEPKAAIARELPGQTVTIQGDQFTADGLVKLVEEAKPAPAAEVKPKERDTSVAACHTALSALFRMSPAGKERSLAILKSWNAKTVEELGGATPDDRDCFLQEVEKAVAELKGGAK